MGCIHSWIPLFKIICVSLAIAWQSVQEGPGFEPILLALLPWLIEIVETRSPQWRTKFDIWIFLFLGTALLGAWVSYDQPHAWSMFWQILMAVILYYTVANLRTDLPTVVTGFASLMACGVAAYFMMTHNWYNQPAEFNLINMIAARWMSLRPSLGLSPIQANSVGGLIAYLFPLSIIGWLGELKRERRASSITYAGLLLFLLLTLIMTSSRGAWFALIAGLVGGVLWRVQVSALPRIRLRPFLISMAFVAVLVGLRVLVSTSQWMPAVIDAVIPGSPSAQSRVTLEQNSLELLADFPFTGGGLGAFPGLYSRYILVIPDFFFSNAHNLYLDLALSQSPLGLLAWALIFLGGLIALMKLPLEKRGDPADLLPFGVLAGFIIVAVHGLVDDPIYASRGLPLLFLYPGMVIAMVRAQDKLEASEEEVFPQPGAHRQIPYLRVGLGIGGLMVLLIAGLIFWPQLISRWHSNIAALTLAKAELDNWPERGELGIEIYPSDRAALVRLDRSLELDPSNRSAWHRRGTLALRLGDFSAAISSLERAQFIDETHPGVRKALAYAYTWSGDFGSAFEQFSSFPEAEFELGRFSWWWGLQGRKDLEDAAAEMERLLAES